jgi:DNA-binding beta-propeller fold protein YncE
MRPVLPLLTVLALLAGCSNRERANPLDPANPQTGGRPQGFNAVAGHALVVLTWTAQPALAIDGFLLQRLMTGDSLYRTVPVGFTPGASGYTDLLVADGSPVRYRLYYLIHGSPGHLPAEDEATPGPQRPWVADAGAGALVRLSPDGRDVASRSLDAGYLQSLAVDPADGRVWTSSSFDGLVTTRLPGDPAPVNILGLGQPFTLAVSQRDHSAWICDLGGALAHYSSAGTSLPGRVALLDTPSGVAISPKDYSVWVCENGGDRVRHYDSIGALGATGYVGAPSRVAVDSITGQAWVTSLALGRVWRLSALGAVLDSSSAASGPIGIAVDSRRGRVWIADAVGNRVVVLDLARMAGVLFTVTGLPQARDVDVDPATGEAWVVARASHEVVRISPAGVVLQRLGGFVDPAEVRVDPGQ